MDTAYRLRIRDFARHLLFWIAYVIYQAINEGWADKDTLSFSIQPSFITDIPVAILLVYINMYVLLPKYLNTRKYLAYLFSLLLLLLTGGLLARFFTYLIWVPQERFTNMPMYLAENKSFFIPIRILRNAVEAYPVIAVTTLIKLASNSYHNEKRMHEMEKANFSAELGLLKAQINPHFIFNTLNSLYGLTLKGSDKAPGVVLTLSGLMRYMLNEASSNYVLLTDEIKYLENFIEIELVRFGDRLDLSFQYSGDIEGKMIAPLLLLPFIENAFKHGITDGSGWITISLKVTENRLYLKVNNNCEPAVPRTGGLGLKNVKRRLELIYPAKHILSIYPEEETFEIDLKLDL